MSDRDWTAGARALRDRGRAAGVAALLVVLTACSSDDEDVQPAEALVPSASSSALTSTDAASTATPTAPATRSTPQPSATASASPEPSSRFEGDPAVQGMRAHFAALHESINSGGVLTPAVRRTSLRSMDSATSRLLQAQKGLRSRGPTPFTPVEVRAVSSGEKEVSACGLDSGWTVDPDTGKPAGKRSVIALVAVMVQESGDWKLGGVRPGEFSCEGVKVP